MIEDATYSEHMRWCKERALRELDEGSVANCLASFASDVRKHPETDKPAITTLIATVGMMTAAKGDVREMRRFIEGFAS